jgi:hypothetical protein
VTGTPQTSQQNAKNTTFFHPEPEMGIMKCDVTSRSWRKIPELR